MSVNDNSINVFEMFASKNENSRKTSLRSTYRYRLILCMDIKFLNIYNENDIL